MLIAVGFVFWCWLEHRTDHDVTEIMLRRFHETNDDIFPSITICDKDPFRYYRTDDEIMDGITIQRYQMFIRGDVTDFIRIREEFDNDTRFYEYIERMNEVDYDNATLDLNELISEFNIKVPIHSELIDDLIYDVVNNELKINKSKSQSELAHLESFQSVKSYISFRHQSHKCFTFDTPVTSGFNIREIQVKIKTSENTQLLDLSKYYVMLTYPRQILRASRGNQIYLNIHKNGNRAQCYKFEVFIGSMEVFKRRNKDRAPCNTFWRNHDEIQFIDMIEELGCRPKHWKIDPGNAIPFCMTANQYDKANKRIDRREGDTPPCRSIEKISKTTKGTDPGFKCSITGSSYLDLRFYLDEERFYKEIVLVPAYTFQNFVGNAGTYFFHLYILFNMNYLL